MSTAKRWSYKTGERGRNRVRAYEDKPEGVILLEFYEPESGVRKRVSLGHRDQSRAKQEADRLASAFGEGHRPNVGDITLGTLFDNYICEVTQQKSSIKRTHDSACSNMFLRFLGPKRKARTLNRRDWDRFIRDRGEGKISPPKKSKPGPVGGRQIAYDLKWLLAVLNWATTACYETGDPYLERNPLRGYPLPSEGNPKQPILADKLYQQLKKVAGSIDWRFELALILAHETGHRIGAVRTLRWSDLDFRKKRVRWRAENDKIGLEHNTPLSPEAVTALKKVRPEPRSIGWVFPGPRDASRPCSQNIMRDWWREGEALAKVKHQPGQGWHSLRRKFATEMKHVPLKDLAHMGGWKDVKSVLRYQGPDEKTQRDALAKRKAI